MSTIGPASNAQTPAPLDTTGELEARKPQSKPDLIGRLTFGKDGYVNLLKLGDGTIGVQSADPKRQNASKIYTLNTGKAGQYSAKYVFPVDLSDAKARVQHLVKKGLITLFPPSSTSKGVNLGDLGSAVLSVLSGKKRLTPQQQQAVGKVEAAAGKISVLGVPLNQIPKIAGGAASTVNRVAKYPVLPKGDPASSVTHARGVANNVIKASDTFHSLADLASVPGSAGLEPKLADKVAEANQIRAKINAALKSDPGAVSGGFNDWKTLLTPAERRKLDSVQAAVKAHSQVRSATSVPSSPSARVSGQREFSDEALSPGKPNSPAQQKAWAEQAAQVVQGLPAPETQPVRLNALDTQLGLVAGPPKDWVSQGINGLASGVGNVVGDLAGLPPDSPKQKIFGQNRGSVALIELTRAKIPVDEQGHFELPNTAEAGKFYAALVAQTEQAGDPSGTGFGNVAKVGLALDNGLAQKYGLSKEFVTGYKQSQDEMAVSGLVQVVRTLSSLAPMMAVRTAANRPPDNPGPRLDVVQGAPTQAKPNERPIEIKPLEPPVVNPRTTPKRLMPNVEYSGDEPPPRLPSRTDQPDRVKLSVATNTIDITPTSTEVVKPVRNLPSKEMRNAIPAPLSTPINRPAVLPGEPVLPGSGNSAPRLGGGNRLPSGGKGLPVGGDNAGLAHPEAGLNVKVRPGVPVGASTSTASPALGKKTPPINTSGLNLDTVSGNAPITPAVASLGMRQYQLYTGAIGSGTLGQSGRGDGVSAVSTGTVGAQANPNKPSRDSVDPEQLIPDFNTMTSDEKVPAIQQLAKRPIKHAILEPRAVNTDHPWGLSLDTDGQYRHTPSRSGLQPLSDNQGGGGKVPPKKPPTTAGTPRDDGVPEIPSPHESPLSAEERTYLEVILSSPSRAQRYLSGQHGHNVRESAIAQRMDQPLSAEETQSVMAYLTTPELRPRFFDGKGLGPRVRALRDRVLQLRRQAVGTAQASTQSATVKRAPRETGVHQQFVVPTGAVLTTGADPNSPPAGQGLFQPEAGSNPWGLSLGPDGDYRIFLAPSPAKPLRPPDVSDWGLSFAPPGAASPSVFDASGLGLEKGRSALGELPRFRLLETSTLHGVDAVAAIDHSRGAHVAANGDPTVTAGGAEQPGATTRPGPIAEVATGADSLSLVKLNLSAASRPLAVAQPPVDTGGPPTSNFSGWGLTFLPASGGKPAGLDASGWNFRMGRSVVGKLPPLEFGDAAQLPTPDQLTSLIRPGNAGIDGQPRLSTRPTANGRASAPGSSAVQPEVLDDLPASTKLRNVTPPRGNNGAIKLGAELQVLRGFSAGKDLSDLLKGWIGHAPSMNTRFGPFEFVGGGYATATIEVSGLERFVGGSVPGASRPRSAIAPVAMQSPQNTPGATGWPTPALTPLPAWRRRLTTYFKTLSTGVIYAGEEKPAWSWKAFGTASFVNVPGRPSSNAQYTWRLNLGDIGGSRYGATNVLVDYGLARNNVHRMDFRLRGPNGAVEQRAVLDTSDPHAPLKLNVIDIGGGNFKFNGPLPMEVKVSSVTSLPSALLRHVPKASHEIGNWLEPLRRYAASIGIPSLDLQAITDAITATPIGRLLLQWGSRVVDGLPNVKVKFSTNVQIVPGQVLPRGLVGELNRQMNPQAPWQAQAGTVEEGHRLQVRTDLPPGLRGFEFPVGVRDLIHTLVPPSKWANMKVKLEFEFPLKVPFVGIGVIPIATVGVDPSRLDSSGGKWKSIGEGIANLNPARRAASSEGWASNPLSSMNVPLSNILLRTADGRNISVAAVRTAPTDVWAAEQDAGAPTEVSSFVPAGSEAPSLDTPSLLVFVREKLATVVPHVVVRALDRAEPLTEADVRGLQKLVEVWKTTPSSPIATEYLRFVADLRVGQRLGNAQIDRLIEFIELGLGRSPQWAAGGRSQASPGRIPNVFAPLPTPDAPRNDMTIDIDPQ